MITAKSLISDRKRVVDEYIINTVEACLINANNMGRRQATLYSVPENVDADALVDALHSRGFEATFSLPSSYPERVVVITW